MWLCRCGSDVSDEDDYYTILIDQNEEEEDVYGDLVALKSTRLNGNVKTADTPGRQPVHVNYQSLHHSASVSFLTHRMAAILLS